MSDVRAAYDAVAEAYERRKTAQPSAPWSDALLERLADELAPGSVVADLGCGHGVEAQRLTGQGLRAVGVDLSAGMLRRARARLPGRLVQGRVEQLPLRTGSVDGVWSLHACFTSTTCPRRWPRWPGCCGRPVSPP